MVYKLKPCVALEHEENEFFIIDQETGFVGKGNKSSYQVFKTLNDWISINEITDTLKTLYPRDQYARIEKSVPNIIQWTLDHYLVDQRES